MIFKSLKSKKLISILKRGGLGVIPTDTLYGIVGSALSIQTVEKIYKIRNRNLKKPLIVLVSSLKQLSLFGIKPDRKIERFLSRIWPGKISVILPCKTDVYLHRGTKTLALRMPNKKDLLELIDKVGPLVAPTANLEGKRPAETVKEAREYFGENIDFYSDSGKLKSLPSTLISIKNGKVNILRQGEEKIISKL